MKKIKVGSDFSGVGAFDQALIRLGIEHETIFACDMDKYARQTYLLNFGEPNYYPENVYYREIHSESLDIYMSSPPCQSFSFAGKRKGEGDKRGILFYNTHEFIVKNKPRYFIIENVKGLLSDDNGQTFSKWITLLGGKSVNGLPVVFPHEDSAPYHVHYAVLNAKHYGVPQNRERVFIVGIRDDVDNTFTFPKRDHLTKKLKDVLESEVDEKYFLSEKMMGYLVNRSDNFNNGKINFKDGNSVASTLCKSSGSIDISDNIISIGFINQDTQASQVFDKNGIMQTICAGTHGYANGYCDIQIGAIRGRNPENTKDRTTISKTAQMLELNKNGTSNTITTVQKDNVVIIGTLRTHKDGNGFREISDNNCPTIPARAREDGSGQPVIEVYQGIAVHPLSKKMEFDGFKDRPCPTLLATDNKAPKCIEFSNKRIRRLTPLECFRLMDFNDDFTWNISDSQAYKQAGNSIVVGVLAKIIKRLSL